MKNLIRIFCLLVAGNISASLFAQIIYTDVNPDITIAAADDSWGMYEIDINRDGINDFLINHHNLKKSQDYQKIEMFTDHPGADVLCDSTEIKYPKSMNIGEAISESATVWYDPNQNQMLLNENGTAGNWIGMADKYVGVRINIAGRWHYGWIRLTIPEDAGSYTIKDFAYNSVPDQAIIAGGNGISSINGSIKDDTQLSIYPNPVSLSNPQINFNIPLKPFNITIYDTEGKIVEASKDNSGFIYIIKNTLKPGFYLILLQFEYSEQILKMMIK